MWTDSLATNELGSYEFILNLIIWYDILVEVNTVSKILQNTYVNIEACNHLWNGLMKFLKLFKDHG